MKPFKNLQHVFETLLQLVAIMKEVYTINVGCVGTFLIRNTRKVIPCILYFLGGVSLITKRLYQFWICAPLGMWHWCTFYVASWWPRQGTISCFPLCTSQVAVIASLMPYLDFIGRSFKTWLQTPTQGRFIFRCNCWGNFSIHYMYAGLATSIRKTYRLVQRKYFNFCEMSGFVHANGSPCPANEWTSCLFEALLAESINHASIKVYLSEIRAQYVLQNNILISYYCQTNTAFIYLRWTN